MTGRDPVFVCACRPWWCSRTGLWRAIVRGLQPYGSIYRFRVVLRTHGGWCEPGAWSAAFRTPRLPLSPEMPHIGCLPPNIGSESGFVHISCRIRGFRVDAFDTPGASPVVGSLAAEDLVGCELQQRTSDASIRGAVSAGDWQACSAGVWSEPEPCSFLSEPRLRERRDDPRDPWQIWECSVRVPAGMVADESGVFRALRRQFRVRARNVAGPGGWSPWSATTSAQRAIAESMTLRYGWGAHRMPTDGESGA